MHVMLDLETVASTSDAAILSIGVVAFDPHSSALGSRFYEVLDVERQLKQYGRKMSFATMRWWMGQSVEARTVFIQDHFDSVEGSLCNLSNWLSSNEPEGVWGNGSDFDNVITLNLFDEVGVARPWSHSKNRCFRTLKNLKLPKEFIQPVREGTHHNALDDAIYQAQYLQAIVKALGLKL